MTDPSEQRPPTRRMDPIDPSAAFGAYEAPNYREPEPYAGTAAGPAVPPPRKPGSGRTVMLSLIALLALVILVIAGILVFRSTRSSGDGSAAASASSSADTTVSEESTTTSTSTSTSTSAPTRSTAAPGAVTYQFTGNGNLIGIRYTTSSGEQLVAAAGAPWSVRTTVSGGSAELSAIVVGGKVTCVIMHGEDELYSATSTGGPISCSASVPTG